MPVAGRPQDRHANEMGYGTTAELLKSHGERSFCYSAVCGNWWHRAAEGRRAFALGSLQAGEPEFQRAADTLSGCEQYSYKHFSR